VKFDWTNRIPNGDAEVSLCLDADARGVFESCYPNHRRVVVELTSSCQFEIKTRVQQARLGQRPKKGERGSPRFQIAEGVGPLSERFPVAIPQSR
jgi:hypothetical protein